MAPSPTSFVQPTNLRMGRPWSWLGTLFVAVVLVAGVMAPLPAGATAGDAGEAGLVEIVDADLLEDLAEAEAELAEDLADAEEERLEDEAKAMEKVEKAREKLAEAEAKLAEAQAALAAVDPDDHRAVRDAEDDVEEAEEKVDKAAEKVRMEQEKADEKLVDVAEDYEEAVAKAHRDFERAVERIRDEQELRNRWCSRSGGYSHEQTTGSMYNINRFIGADEAWEDGHTGAGIDVAVIDTGTVPVEGLHENVVYGPDLSLESIHPEAHQLDTYGHGTHIAGIIAGNDHDTVVEELDPTEFQGVAPDSRIVSVKVADHSGAVDVSQVIAAIEWVIAHRNDNGLNIRVLNLSYQAAAEQPYTVDPLAQAVEAAWEAGIVVVVAAGNDGKKATQLGNPAYDPHVLTVSAVLEEKSQRSDNCLRDDHKWKTTDYASEADHADRQPDIYAPGSTVVSLRNPGSFVDTNFPASIVGDRFARATGTSQSAAVVSGAVAVLLSARPELTPDEVKAILVESADGGKVPVLDLGEALDEDVPRDAEQNWERSDGSGTLDAARGDDIIELHGHPLTGQNTIFGPWTGSSWTGSSWTGSSWTGSSWTGSSWTGSSWTGSSWTGSSWTGSSWTGSSWTGSSWTGSSWTGSSWTGSGSPGPGHRGPAPPGNDRAPPVAGSWVRLAGSP